MSKDFIPGGFSKDDSEFELNYWENYGGVDHFDLHLNTYERCFPMASLDFNLENILDIGSGAVSIFEKIAPVGAKIVPFDVLAEDYNRIAPEKKFPIVNKLQEVQEFSLVTLFNMIDHVVEPTEILSFAAQHLKRDGRVWLAVHLYQPHGPKGHPQNFNAKSIVDLIATSFSIDKCGVIRESVPHPYIWWGQLSTIKSTQSRFHRRLLQLKVGARVMYFQTLRAVVKLMKLFGMRKLLRMDWRF